MGWLRGVGEVGKKSHFEPLRAPLTTSLLKARYMIWKFRLYGLTY